MEDLRGGIQDVGFRMEDVGFRIWNTAAVGGVLRLQPMLVAFR